MPKLILKFDDSVLKEFAVGPDVTIGRLPDNGLVIDNPAVSGHHARVFLDGDQYVVEDLRSRNGTYVNERPVIRHALHNGDVMLVGKHKLVFDEAAVADPTAPTPVVPTLGQTAYLDTRKHRALLAKLREDRARERAQAQASAHAATAPGAAARGVAGRVGMLRVVAGESAQSEYRLDERTSFIGKSEAALVRLRGWFTPRAVAAIEQTEHGYALMPLSSKVRINSARLNGSRELKDGDLLEFSGLTLRFQLTDQPRHPFPAAGNDETSTVSSDATAPSSL
jgi:pSer/pThr/pTyr-binding forkhead associated (FHA) protein